MNSVNLIVSIQVFSLEYINGFRIMFLTIFKKKKAIRVLAFNQYDKYIQE